MVQDRKTGEWYDPAVEWDRIFNSPEFLAQLRRMKNEQGFGWPARQQNG